MFASSQKIVFNHFYRLRHDRTRSCILSPSLTQKTDPDFVNPNLIVKIHPIYAMIFSFFSFPIELGRAIGEIAEFLDITEEQAEKLIVPFLNRGEPLRTTYGGTTNQFPKNILIDASKAIVEPIEYRPEQFAYDTLDFHTERINRAPATMGFMVTNRCGTDCIYCYADKSVRAEPLPWERVRAMIREARKLGIVDITMLGGEFFLYKDWERLVETMNEEGFGIDFISTKLPLSESTIRKLKTYGIRLQISLDSLNAEKLVRILKVGPDYAERIERTIRLLEQYEITFQIATVLTNLNDDIENLDELHRFLAQFTNLRRWEIRVGFRSLYSRKDFDDFKITSDKITAVARWIEKIQQSTSINILWAPDTPENYFQSTGGSRTFKGNRCSANYSNMVVLPDGRVTICEQLYWHPHFLIGDVRTQTLAEIWNSPRALALAALKKEDLRDVSVCKKCEMAEECLAYPNRCYADILKGYGWENWDYPDPRCVKAPALLQDLFHK